MTSGESAKPQTVTIPVGGGEWTIQKRPDGIRMTSTGPVDLTEVELVNLLCRAVRAGILSPEFLSKLREEFEI